MDRGGEAMNVEIWTHGYGKRIWRGRLSGVPRPGDGVALDRERLISSCERVLRVDFILDEDVARVEINFEDALGQWPEVGA
jgi:hypothetical protein